MFGEILEKIEQKTKKIFEFEIWELFSEQSLAAPNYWY